MRERFLKDSLGDMAGPAWFNGVIVDFQDPRTHPLSHGLQYGGGIFDGIRARGGRIFKLSEHMARFRRGAEKLTLDLSEYTQEVLEQAAEQIVSEGKLKDAYIRPFAWGGPGQVYFQPGKNPTNVAIFAWPYAESLVPEGSKLRMAIFRRPSPDAAPYDIKASGNYLPATMSKRVAANEGYQDTLFLDHEGFMADTTGANAFFVFDGELHTPQIDGFFSGITRKTVIELAEADGMRVVERKIPLKELGVAQEFILVGTATGISPVGSVCVEEGKTVIFDGKRPVVERLRAQYAELTRE